MATETIFCHGNLNIASGLLTNCDHLAGIIEQEGKGVITG
jgi:hypothetical protein